MKITGRVNNFKQWMIFILLRPFLYKITLEITPETREIFYEWEKKTLVRWEPKKSFFDEFSSGLIDMKYGFYFLKKKIY